MAAVTDQEWADYKAKFQKSYPDDAEDKKRRELYATSKAQVEAHNVKHAAGEVTYSMGINHFCDLTDDEKKMRCGSLKQPKTD